MICEHQHTLGWLPSRIGQNTQLTRGISTCNGSSDMSIVLKWFDLPCLTWFDSPFLIWFNSWVLTGFDSICFKSIRLTFYALFLNSNNIMWYLLHSVFRESHIVQGVFEIRQHRSCWIFHDSENSNWFWRRTL